MRLLYNTGLFLFVFVVKVASLFHGKARLFVAGRRNLFSCLDAVARAGAPVAWFHCASLGEFEQGRPVMEAYRAKYPQHKILLTFFSPSGYEVRKNYEGADFVFYLPIDTPRNARRFVRTVKPVVAVFIKYEFWYNVLHHLKKARVPAYVVSAVFRRRQMFFRWYGCFFRRMLHSFRLLFVQDENSVALLHHIGINNVMHVGDTRFDRVCAHVQHPSDLPLVKAFAARSHTLVAGSTWPPDEENLARVWAFMPVEAQLIIAPHEVGEERIKAIEKWFAGYHPVRYTKVKTAAAWQPARVLIVDTVGLLLSVYRYGQAAYVGGGFSATGIHNILEAAAYGLPVVFGPNYRKYVEAHALIAAGGACSAGDVAALKDTLQSWLLHDETRLAAGRQAAGYVKTNSGATGKIMAWL
ncbi:MAG: 3-deoxy-D-manno-octulosonic acid transferase [Prevotellaceae bacterium]|nr:3-deoxy-D-manno-octulosonic acid transferase [Prevotellaceae bacterium]